MLSLILLLIAPSQPQPVMCFICRPLVLYQLPTSLFKLSRGALRRMANQPSRRLKDKPASKTLQMMTALGLDEKKINVSS